MGWFRKRAARPLQRHGVADGDCHRPPADEDQRTDRIIARLEAVSEQVADSASSTMQSADRLDSALTTLETMLQSQMDSSSGE